MRDDLPGHGMKAIWLNQQSETSAMTPILIEQRSRELRAKTRRKLIGTLAAPLAAAAFCAYAIKEFAGLRQLLQLPFAFALAWSLAGLYFLNRGMWSTVKPGDLGSSTGLDSCRREIERQRDLVRGVLLWSFGPVMLAIGTFVAALAMVSTRARGIYPNGLPFLILIVVWIVSWFVIRYREQRELQREIDELNGIQRENRNRA